jgi:hypothetical protein
MKITEKIGGIFLNKYDYKDIIENIFGEMDTLNNVYPTILPQWDNSPRSGRRSIIYTNSTPELFKLHLREAISLLKSKENENKILLLKSWNEWAEGNYIEPDLKFGHGYLDVLKEMLIDSNTLY